MINCISNLTDQKGFFVLIFKYEKCRSSLSHASLMRFNDRLGAVADVQLGEDVADPVAHGLDAQRQALSDGSVDQALRHQRHFRLAAIICAGTTIRLEAGVPDRWDYLSYIYQVRD